MSTPKPKAVVIISGGLDSTTLLYDVDKSFYTVNALSFNYGQRHVRELIAAKASCKILSVPHTIVDISAAAHALLGGSVLMHPDVPVPEGRYDAPSMRDTVVSNRNMILLSWAIGYAGSIHAEAVFYGAHAGDHAIYPDCRPEFVEKMRELAKISNWSPIELWAPYIKMTKAEILRRGLQLGVDYSLTWTCYVGQDKPCGKCGACNERAEAFEINRVQDPLL